MNEFIVAVAKLEAVLLKHTTTAGSEPNEIVRYGREVRKAAHAYFAALEPGDPVVASASHLQVTALVLDRLLAAYEVGSGSFNWRALAKLGPDTSAGRTSYHVSGLRVLSDVWGATRAADKLTWLNAVLEDRDTRGDPLFSQALLSVADRMVIDALQTQDMATLEKIFRLGGVFSALGKALQADHGARVIAFAAERAGAAEQDALDDIVTLANRARKVFAQQAPKADVAAVERDMARIQAAVQRRHVAPREEALQRLLTRVARAGGPPEPDGNR